MTAASTKIDCFAVHSSQARIKADVNYWRPQYQRNEKLIQNSRWPLVTIGSLIEPVSGVKDGPGGWLINKRDYTEDGIPVIRAMNVTEAGLDLSGLVFISEEKHRELIATEILPNDLLLTMRGTIGRAAVVPEFVERANMNAAVCRIRLRDRRLNSFVRDFFNSQPGRIQAQRSGQKAVQGDLNLDAIREFVIPLPPFERAEELTSQLERCRLEAATKSREAHSLLDGVDSSILEELGLTAAAPHDPHVPFAVRSESLWGTRIDPLSHSPFPIHSNPLRIPIRPLGDIARINKHRWKGAADGTLLVPYVGLPECDLNDVREIATRNYEDVKGRAVVEVGDILFARIEPSIFNKKYVFVDRLFGFDQAFLSTEFYSVDVAGTRADKLFVYALLHSSFVFNQVRGKTTGSSGRRRLDRTVFETLLVPWPDESTRKRIAGEVQGRRRDAKALKLEARKLWEEGKRAFEQALFERV